MGISATPRESHEKSQVLAPEVQKPACDRSLIQAATAPDISNGSLLSLPSCSSELVNCKPPNISTKAPGASPALDSATTVPHHSQEPSETEEYAKILIKAFETTPISAPDTTACHPAKT